jgi:HlyD family secretion protein
MHNWFLRALTATALAMAVAFMPATAAAAGESADKPADKKEKPAEKKEQPAKEEKPAKPKAETYTVKTGPLKVQVSLTGVFEAAKTAEIALDPQVWQNLVVVEAVDQGTAVKAGDVILRLDADKLKEQIADLEADGKLSDLTFKLAQQELKMYDQTVPMDMAAVERANRIAHEDLQQYNDKYKDFDQRAAKFSLKTNQDYLAYAQEELKQLEKMYKADDVTEDTEEIVLKRQRDTVERVQFALERTKLTTEDTLNFAIPRNMETLKDTVARQELRMASAKKSFPVFMQQKKLEFAKLKRTRQKAADTLAKLKSDLESFTVKAPADGVVYYGSATRGKWTTAPAAEAKLRPGGKLAPYEVVMTIVQPGPAFIHTTVPEKELRHFKPNVEGTATPDAYPDMKLKVKAAGLQMVPVAPGSFDAKLAFVAKNAQGVVPGMGCSITLVPYDKKDALTVPSSAVFTDDDNADQQVVYVQAKDGKAEKRAVKTGQKEGDKTEVVEGLKEGDTILLKKPE